MAWTSPRTWVADEVPTNAQMNTELRDNFNETAPAKATAKGDLFFGTGSNAIARLAVGANKTILVANSATATGWNWGAQPIPTGVGFLGIFAGACPSGWTEYTAARGRAIVGTPSSGTDEGTVGTALTNLQNKTHTHTGPSHAHSISRTTDAEGFSGVEEAPGQTNAGGTGATGTSAMSDMFAYIQLRICEKT